VPQTVYTTLEVAIVFRASPGGDPPEPPAALCWPGGATPQNPPPRFAPARWYIADTPALAEASGPGSLAGYNRLAVGPATGLADSTGHSPGLRPGFAGPVRKGLPAGAGSPFALRPG